MTPPHKRVAEFVVLTLSALALVAMLIVLAMQGGTS